MSTVLVTKQQPKKKVPKPSPSRFTSAFVTVSAPSRPSRSAHHRRRKNNKSPDVESHQIPALVETETTQSSQTLTHSNPKSSSNTSIRPSKQLTKAPLLTRPRPQSAAPTHHSPPHSHSQSHAHSRSQPAWRRPRVSPPKRPVTELLSLQTPIVTESDAAAEWISRRGPTAAISGSGVSGRQPRGRYQLRREAIAYDPSDVDMTVKTSNPFERNMHGMRPGMRPGLNSRVGSNVKGSSSEMAMAMAVSRGGMARYNSVGKQKQSHTHSPLSSSTHSSTSTSTATSHSNSTLTKSVNSNTPPSTISTASAPTSPAPGLRRHIPEVAADAKVTALEPFQTCECGALRTANAAMAAEMSALRKRFAKKEAECRALEEALLCVARTSEAVRKQKEKEREKVKEEKEKERETETEQRDCKHREWNYDGVYRWIAGIDGGYFSKYGEMYDKLKMLNIDGRCLEKMNEAVVGRIGVTEVHDQLYLMQHIHSLLNSK